MRLRDGRDITVRPLKPDDGPALAALYAALTPEDRHLRFFSAHRITDQRADELAHVGEHGGFGVAAVEPSTGDVVGDGRCGPIEQGLTDMAVTVRPDYQGVGLGAVLRDALSAEARARRVDLLVADVLADNERMHGVLKAVPHAVVDRPGDHVVRVAYSPAGDVPGWPQGETAVRVLVESRAWLGTMDERALREAGAEVAVCPGPDAVHGRRCPVAEGRSCPLVDGADAVIFGLPLDEAAGRRILESHAARTVDDGSPVFVRRWPTDAGVPAADRVTVCTGPMDVDDLLARLRARADRRDRLQR